LDLLTSFAGEEPIADDACSAILTLSGKSMTGVPKDKRQKALEAVVQNSKNQNSKKKAEELLKKIL
jgi:hypothetical protein